MKLDQLIIRPIITEKSMKETQNGVYAFQVVKEAKKPQIKEAIESFFGVKVLKVRVLKRPGKRYRVGRHRQQKIRKDLKKAIVQLAKDDKIEVFESLGE